MIIEKLGYKRVEEEEYLSRVRTRYEKDTTVYEVNNNIVPKDKIQYHCRTILVYKSGAYYSEGISSNSFEEARKYSVMNPSVELCCLKMAEYLSFDEMEAILKAKEIDFEEIKAILEMKEKGESNDKH